MKNYLQIAKAAEVNGVCTHEPHSKNYTEEQAQILSKNKWISKYGVAVQCKECKWWHIAPIGTINAK